VRPPLVSVVLPVRDGELFLGGAIGSILGQSFEDLELLVVDDASTDGTPDIAQRASARDKRVLVVANSGKGEVDAIETGIAASSGEFIARMDADDVALPWRLERQVSHVQEHPDLGLLGGAIEMIDEAGRFLTTVSYPTDPVELRDLVLAGVCFASPTLMIRRAALREVGGFRRLFEPAEDVDLCLRIAERYPVANLAEPVVRYRIHGNNISVRSFRRQKEGVVVAMAAARRRREGADDPTASVVTLAAARSQLGIGQHEVEELMFQASLNWINLLGMARAYAQLPDVVAQARLSIPFQSDPEDASRLLETALASVRHGSEDGGARKPAASAVSSATAECSRGGRALRLMRTGGGVLLTEGPREFARRVGAWRARHRSSSPSSVRARALGSLQNRVRQDGWPLVREMPRRLRRRTSVTDVPSYTRLCAQAARDDAVFATFKRLPAYTAVLEHVSCDIGAQYLETALDQTPALASVLEEAKRNDSLGSPRTCVYGQHMFSPTTLRYLKVLSDLLTLFGPLDKLSVVEIGVGYGGQCFVASAVGFRSWTLIDLPPVLELAGRYLGELGVENVERVTPGETVVADLIVSNYAFSECTRRVQLKYLDTVVSRARRGYMTCNFLDGMQRDELAACVPGSRWVDERPLTGKDNAILVWNDLENSRSTA
jgi:putative sugar O-methyltransferase